MDVSNCWMTLVLLGLLPLQGVLGAVLLRGEDMGEVKLFFWPQPEVEALLGSGPIARSTDLLKRSPNVDFVTTLENIIYFPRRFCYASLTSGPFLVRVFLFLNQMANKLFSPQRFKLLNILMINS